MLGDKSISVETTKSLTSGKKRTRKFKVIREYSSNEQISGIYTKNKNKKKMKIY